MVEEIQKSIQENYGNTIKNLQEQVTDLTEQLSLVPGSDGEIRTMTKQISAMRLQTTSSLRTVTPMGT